MTEIGRLLPASAEGGASVLLALEDRMRSVADPADVLRTAAEVLGTALGADDVALALVDRETGELRPAAGWPGAISVPDRDVSSRPGLLREGGTVVVSEGAGELAAPLLPQRTEALLGVPVRQDGFITLVLLAGQASPRAWTRAEIDLAEAVAGRAWAAVERAGAEERLRISEAEARARAEEIAALYASAPIGLCVLDREGRYIRINDVLATNNGLPAADHIGRKVRDVLPGLADQIEAILVRVLAGEELRGVEVTGTTPGQPGVLRSWRETWEPLRDAGGRIAGVTISVEEITPLKAAARRQAYLLRLEDRLHSAPCVREALEAACEALGRELGVALVGFSALEEADAVGVVDCEWRAGETPSAIGRHRLATFGEGRVGPLLAGETVVVGDAAHDPRIPDPSGYLALGVQSSVDVPFVREGRVRGFLFVADARPRAWTSGEIALVRETAERAWEAAERARAETELRESEASFRQMAETIREVFSVLEVDERRMSYVSPAYEEVWGRPLAELYADARTFMDGIHPDDLPSVQANLSRLWTGEAVDGEYRLLRPDGSVRHIHDRAFVTADPVSGRRRAIGLAADVTERRRIEERLQMATEAAGLGIFDVNLVTLDMQWDSRQRKLWGVAPDAVITDEMFQAGVHPDDRPIMQEAVGRALDPKGDGLYRAEFRIRPLDGGAGRWIAAMGQAHFEGSRAVRLIGTVQDITERKAAEAAVAQSEARFRALANTLPALIFIADAERRTSWVNDSFVSFSGLPSGQLVGRGWMRTVHPDDMARAREGTAASWRRGRPYVAETRFRRADGSYRWHLVRGQPITDDEGQVLQWVGAGIDIQELVEAREALAASRTLVEEANAELEARVAERTAELRQANARLAAEIERREAAQAALVQAQKLEAVGQLTSGIAHDFNNVIAAIAGGFSVIERRTQDPRLIEVARHGAKAAERGGLLVKQLLAFARQQVLAPQACDLPSLLREAEPLIARSLGPGIELAIACPEDLGEVRIDPVQLEAALINLAVNAHDAMEGGGRLSIEARPSGAGEPGRPLELGAEAAVAISISDTGSGIHPDLLPRVVEPFFTTKAPGRGTGLGLAMVHGFVHQSGGALRIQSREGEGTVVTLYLPRAGERLPEAPPVALPDVLPLVAGARVLLVDDDSAVRGVTAAQLSDLGFAVVEAGSAEEALIQLEAHPDLDAVLSDVVMPGPDGVALAAAIRERRPDLPILLMTGHADRARLAGEVVLDKPFTPQALVAALAERIGSRRAPGQPNS